MKTKLYRYFTHNYQRNKKKTPIGDENCIKSFVNSYNVLRNKKQTPKGDKTNNNHNMREETAMSCLYVVEQGSKIKHIGGQFILEVKDGENRVVPDEILESISIFGNSVLTTQAIKACLEKNINVSFLSTKGRYFGKLMSNTATNPDRLKAQAYLSDNIDQCLKFAKIILKAKINNQDVILRRYAKNSETDISSHIKDLKIYEEHIEKGKAINEIMGYEGIAAKTYFEALSKLIKPEFKFSGRNKRPPKDAFNSMLSLGYSLIYNEIFSEIENRNLSPYIGFIHKLKDRHPALVSDLIEEWRAVLIDSTMMSLVQGNEILIEEFTKDEYSEAVFISDLAVKQIVRKIENKLRSQNNYLEYLNEPISFRKAIWWQIKSLASCIENGNLTEYKPIRIR